MANEIPTKEIGELLDEVSTKIPKLLTSLMDTLYSAEAGNGGIRGGLNELVNVESQGREAVKWQGLYTVHEGRTVLQPEQIRKMRKENKP